MPIRVEGLTETEDAIDRVSREIADVEPRLVDLAGRVEALVLESAAEERSPDGRAWAPRKATTVRRGRGSTRSRDTGHLGVVSGRMLASVRTDVTGSTATIEVTAPHAAFFSGGTSRQPARRLLPESGDRGPAGEILDAWTDETADEIAEAFDG